MTILNGKQYLLRKREDSKPGPWVDNLTWADKGPRSVGLNGLVVDMSLGTRGLAPSIPRDFN